MSKGTSLRVATAVSRTLEQEEERPINQEVTDEYLQSCFGASGAYDAVGEQTRSQRLLGTVQPV